LRLIRLAGAPRTRLTFAPHQVFPQFRSRPLLAVELTPLGFA
jgi:hypothetical protein